MIGGYQGGLDGIDVWADSRFFNPSDDVTTTINMVLLRLTQSDIWIHDVTVSNKDECVTVKSLAHNMLIEDIYSNASGGCAMGSLGTGTSRFTLHQSETHD